MGAGGGALREARAATRVALVGGGHAHVVALRALARRYRMGGDAALAVVLVSEAAQALYSGMVPSAVAGDSSEGELEIDLRGLCAWAGAEFREGTVTGVAWDSGELLLSCGGREAFDFVSFNVGSFTSAPAHLRCSPRALATRPLAAFLPRLRHIESELSEREREEREGEGEGEDSDGAAVTQPRRVAVVGAGAAGVELAFAFQTRIERQGRIAMVTLVNGGGDAPLAERGEAAAARVAEKLAARGIAVVEGRAVRQETDGALVLDGGRTLACDIAVWATGAASQPCARNLGLCLDEGGFIRVAPTLRALGRPQAFAVGDCCAVEGHRLAKAGVYSVREGAVLADNLCRLLEGRPLEPYRPQAGFLALVNTGDGEAISSWRGLSFCGTAMMRLKDHIDGNFMRSFTPAELGPSPQHPEEEASAAEESKAPAETQ